MLLRLQKKNACDRGHRQVKQIIDSKHCLYQVVLFLGEVLLGRTNGKFPVGQLYTKPVECHGQEGVFLRSIEFATGPFEIPENITIVGEEVVAILALDIDLEIIVVAIEIRRRDLDPFFNLPERGRILEPREIIFQQFVRFSDHLENPPV